MTVPADAPSSITPRFSWRGLMLDGARHAWPAGTWRSVLDEVAAGHGNRLHLHLTDDQGWNLPLPPGWSWRGPAPGLTRQDIIDLVAHGRDLGVECVPEVDLPGHCGALLEGRPELACPGRGGPRPRAWGCHDALLCLGHPDLADVVDSLLDHLACLFPFGVVHLGGDEVPARAWRGCPRCAALVAREGLSSVDGLPGWWLRFLAPRLAARGLRGAYWDEALDAGAPAGSILFAWRGAEAVRRCLAAGYDTVACPQSPCYLDHYPDLDQDQPRAIGGWNPQEALRSFQPLPAGFGEATGLLLGAQANLWTEYVPDEAMLMERLQPRLDALLLALWSGPAAPRAEATGWARRLEEMKARGWRPRLEPPRAQGAPRALAGRSLALDLASSMPGTLLELREDGGPWRQVDAGRLAWQPSAAGRLRLELRERLPHSDLASRPRMLELCWDEPWPGRERDADGDGVEVLGLVAREPDWRQVSEDKSQARLRLPDWDWPVALMVESLGRPRPVAGPAESPWRDGPPTPELPPLSPWGAVRGLSRRGWIRIHATGIFGFRLGSQSLARLWVDDRLALDHDGFAPAGIREAWVPLAEGWHCLRLDWLDLRGGSCHLEGPQPAPSFQRDATHDAEGKPCS